MANQAFGRRDDVALLADRVGVGAGEAIDFFLGRGRTASIAGDDDFLLGKGDGVAAGLGGGSGDRGDGGVGSIKEIKGSLMVAGSALLASGFDILADLGEEFIIGRGFFGRGGRLGGRRIALRGVSSLLRGFGLGDGRADGGEAFGGADILGVDGEDRLKFCLGGLQVTFIAGL